MQERNARDFATISSVWAMLKNIFIPLVSLFAFSQTLASYPIPEYEIVVVETSPPLVALDMSLSQITEAKEQSEFQKAKERVYEVISKHVSPLLSDADFVDGYNLVQLAAKLPASEILGEILGEDLGRQAPGQANDFLVIILPRQPRSTLADRQLPYANLYSNNKAAVIDSRKVGFTADGYMGPINERLHQTMEFVYNRNFVEMNNNEAFFVGALIQLHIDGNQSTLKGQMVGSLPTDMDLPFSQIEPQAEFTAIRLPRSPESKYYYNSFQGAIVELDYQPYSGLAPKLKIQFGELGKISAQGWVLNNALDDLESKPAEWNGEFGVRSFLSRFNVPHLFGEVREASGFGPLDSTLAFLYNIQINIHEVELDLQELKITGMRATVELPVKEYNWFTSIIEPGLRWPTAEVPSITQKVMDGGNEQLEPYREQIQSYLDMGGTVFSDKDTQQKIVSLLISILENKTGVQP